MHCIKQVVPIAQNSQFLQGSREVVLCVRVCARVWVYTQSMSFNMIQYMLLFII